MFDKFIIKLSILKFWLFNNFNAFFLKERIKYNRNKIKYEKIIKKKNKNMYI